MGSSSSPSDSSSPSPSGPLTDRALRPHTSPALSPRDFKLAHNSNTTLQLSPSPLSRMFSSLKKRAQALVHTTNAPSNNVAVPQKHQPPTPPSPCASLSVSLSSSPSSISSASTCVSPPPSALELFDMVTPPKAVSKSEPRGFSRQMPPPPPVQFHLTVVDVDTAREEERQRQRHAEKAEHDHDDPNIDPFAKDDIEGVPGVDVSPSRRSSLFFTQPPSIPGSPTASSSRASSPSPSLSRSLSLALSHRRRSAFLPDRPISAAPISPLPSPPASAPSSPLSSTFPISPFPYSYGYGGGLSSTTTFFASAAPSCDSLTRPISMDYSSPSSSPSPARSRARSRSPDPSRREMASESEDEGRPLHPSPDAVSPIHAKQLRRLSHLTPAAVPTTVLGPPAVRSGSNNGRPSSKNGRPGSKGGRPGSAGGSKVLRRPGSAGRSAVRPGSAGRSAARPGSKNGRPGSASKSGRPGSRGGTRQFVVGASSRPGSKSGRPGSARNGGQTVRRMTSKGSLASFSSADTDWTLYIGALGMFAEGLPSESEGEGNDKNKDTDKVDAAASTAATATAPAQSSFLAVPTRTRANADVPHSPSPPQSPFASPLPPQAYVPDTLSASLSSSAARSAPTPPATPSKATPLKPLPTALKTPTPETDAQGPPSPTQPSSLAASVTAAAARARLAAAVRALDNRFFSSGSASPGSSPTPSNLTISPPRPMPARAHSAACVPGVGSPVRPGMAMERSYSSGAVRMPPTPTSASPKRDRFALGVAAGVGTGEGSLPSPTSPLHSNSRSALPLNSFTLSNPPPSSRLTIRPPTPPSPTPAPRGLANAHTSGFTGRPCKSTPTTPVRTTFGFDLGVPGESPRRASDDNDRVRGRTRPPPLPLSMTVPRMLPAHRPLGGPSVGIAPVAVIPGPGASTVKNVAKERAKLFSREAQNAPASVLAELASGLSMALPPLPMSSLSNPATATASKKVMEKRRSFIDFGVDDLDLDRLESELELDLASPVSSCGESDGSPADWTLGLGAVPVKGLGLSLGSSLGRRRGSRVVSPSSPKAGSSASVKEKTKVKSRNRLSGVVADMQSALEKRLSGGASSAGGSPSAASKKPGSLRVRTPEQTGSRTRPRSFVLSLSSPVTSPVLASARATARDSTLTARDSRCDSVLETPGPSFLDLEWPKPPASPPPSLRGAASARSLHSLHSLHSASPGSVRSLRSAASAVSLSAAAASAVAGSSVPSTPTRVQAPLPLAAPPLPFSVSLPSQNDDARRPVFTRSSTSPGPAARSTPSPAPSQSSIATNGSGSGSGRKTPLSPVKNRPGTPRRATLPRLRPQAPPMPLPSSWSGANSQPRMTSPRSSGEQERALERNGPQSAPVDGGFELRVPVPGLLARERTARRASAMSVASNASFVSCATNVSSATITPASAAAAAARAKANKAKHVSTAPSAYSVASTTSSRASYMLAPPAASGSAKSTGTGKAGADAATPRAVSLGRAGARGVARLLAGGAQSKRDEERAAAAAAKGGVEVSGWF
ncbi:hypothetical protein HGRIS_014476 [Hohenbuehelia grisea]|uniref:Proteophosphoglycan ppg4 n=1 Tax=Hohenbuehelia grisea TaxID=104357 RepID=A0ABR3JVB5_9AGAR